MDCAAGVDIHKLYGYYGDNMNRYLIVHNVIQNWPWLMNDIYPVWYFKIKTTKLGLACSTLKRGPTTEHSIYGRRRASWSWNSLHEVRLAPIRITQTTRVPDYDTRYIIATNSKLQWASCQIRKIAGAHAPGMPGTFSPSPQVSDPDMHHGTCVTHVPWCMPGSLTSGFLWNRRRGKMFPAFPAHAQPAILRIW